MARQAAHGTDSGYQKHLRLKQRPCLRCCDAHRSANERREQARTRVRVDPDVLLVGYFNADDPAGYLDARLGNEPAEALGQRDRWRLVAELHRVGWSDVRIAAHTRMTPYTTRRILAALGLAEGNSHVNHSLTAVA